MHFKFQRLSPKTKFPCVSGGNSNRETDPLEDLPTFAPAGSPNEYVNLKSPDPAYINLQVTVVVC